MSRGILVAVYRRVNIHSFRHIAFIHLSIHLSIYLSIYLLGLTMRAISVFSFSCARFSRLSLLCVPRTSSRSSDALS